MAGIPNRRSIRLLMQGAFWVCVTALLTTCCVALAAALKFVSAAGGQAAVSDPYEGVGAVVGAFALVGVVLMGHRQNREVQLQRRELQMQRQQLELQRREMELQRIEMERHRAEMELTRAEMELQRAEMGRSQCELRRTADIGYRGLHVELIRMAINDPDLADVWPASFGVGADHRKVRQMMYANLIIQHHWLGLADGHYSEDELRGHLEPYFESALLREFWGHSRRARRTLPPNSPEARFSDMIDEILDHLEIAPPMSITEPDAA